MDNVVSLTTRRIEKKTAKRKTEAEEFISQFYDWALTHGIDVGTTEFKYDTAVILTTVQSLLHKRG